MAIFYRIRGGLLCEQPQRTSVQIKNPKVIKREEANIALARDKEESVAKSIDKLDRLIQKNDRSADSNKEIQKTVKELNNAYRQAIRQACKARTASQIETAVLYALFYF